MLIDLAWVVAGLAVLVLAGDALVKGAVNLSLRLGVPALVVGLTIVAFGTSAPELIVSVQAVLRGAAPLALGNVVGSNIANILLVMGIPALIAAVAIGRDVTRDFVIMMAATVLFIGLAFGGVFGRAQGAILLVGLALMLTDCFIRARNARNGARNGAAALDEADPGMPGWRIGAYVLAGIVGLPLGADMLVDGSVNIAMALGVSEAVIGLTLVAVGTSLPELATTVMAAIRREGGVAMGNIIGSNVFNLLGIIGVAALVGPIPVPPEMLGRDLWVMLACSALLALFIFSGRAIGRWTGAVFLALYVLYLASLF